MTDSKMLILFNALSSKEQKAFEHYLLDPSLNIPSKHSEIFHYLSKKGNQKPSKLEKETIYKALYPGKAFNNNQAKKLFSSFTKSLEQFYIQQERAIEDDNLLLAKAFRRRGMDKFFKQTTQQSIESLVSSPLSTQSVYEKYFLEEQIHIHHSKSASRKLEQIKLLERNAESRNKQIDIFGQLVKCNSYIEQIILNNVFKQNFDPSSAVKFLQQEHPNHVLLELYLKTLHLFLNRKIENFKEVKKVLENEIDRIHESEAKKICSYLENFCVNQINHGDTSYIEHVYSIYQLREHFNLLLENNSIRHSLYKNIVSIGLSLNEKEWIHNFIENYKENINIENRHSAYHYCLGFYFYHMKNLDDALSHLMEVSFDDVYYSASVRLLLLKINYEQNDIISFDANFDSFSIYLRRDKQMSEHQKENRLNLLKTMRKAFQIKNSVDSKQEKQQKTAQLITFVESEDNIMNKDYLRKILEELSNL